MSKFIAAVAVSLLLLNSLSDVNAQSRSQASVSDILQERLQKLESICGEWYGQLGNESVNATFFMEDSSSAIGEMQTGDKVFFLHCFAEDMAKDDRYAVGGADGYDYCIMQQSGGEVVSMMYLSLAKGKLSGISVNDFGKSQISFSRKAGDVKKYRMSDKEPVNFDDDKWGTVSYLNTVEAYESYLADFPQGRHVSEAKDQIKFIKEEEARIRQEKEDQELWEKTLAAGTKEAYEAYLEYPLEYKAYERFARGRYEGLKASEADERGDFDAVLEALDKAEEHIALTKDMLSLRLKNQELKAYNSYLDADATVLKISRGIDFVNTYLNSEKYDEVSDRVAYLMASSPAFLAGTTKEAMLSYAKTEKTREYVTKEWNKAARKRYRQPSNPTKVGFNMGIGGAVNMSLEDRAPVYGGHILLSVGDNRNFMNLEMGFRYGYWNFVNKADAADAFDFHQLRLVMAPKFNLIRQKKSAFYMYVAPEAAYGYPIDLHARGTYEANSLSLGGRVGIGYGHFDLSASYMYDYWPMVASDFEGSYSPTMVGVALTIYLSGSGR